MSYAPSQTVRRSTKLTLVRKLLFSGVACIAFIFAVEGILWLVGTETVLEREDPFRGFSRLVSVFELNGDVFRTRQPKGYRTFNDQSFLARKPVDTVRIFCLGGSSAYGFPWDAQVAFPAILADVLSAAYPDQRFEAVNVAGMSYAMHRLRIVANEIMSYEPDMIIIYSGHNEFVETDFFRQLKHRSRQRQWLEHSLARSRFYSSIQLLLNFQNKSDRPTDQERFEMFVRREPATFTKYQKQEIAAGFRNGLESIVRMAHERGVKVLLATVPCNLRHWRPEESIIGRQIDRKKGRHWSAAQHSGKRHLEAGRWIEAIRDLESALSIAPNYAQSHYLIAQAFEGREQWDEARQAYERACDLDASPNRRISAINEAVRSVTRAEQTLFVDVDRIFVENSEYGLVGFNLIEDYVHPTQEGHQLIAWHMWLAIDQTGWLGPPLHPQRVFFDEAVANRSIDVSHRTAQVLYNQGVVFAKQGHETRALDTYRRALSVNPNHEAVLFNLGGMLYARNELDEAKSLLEKLLRIDPEYDDARKLYGSVLLGQGQVDDAMTQLRQVVQRKPEDAKTYYTLGTALNSQGKINEAIEQFRRAIELEPDLVRAHNNMAGALQSQGKYQEAIQHYQQILRVQPDDAKALYNMAGAWNLVGKIDEAIESYRRAIEAEPDYAKAHHQLGVMLCRQGKFQLAIHHLGQAIAADPDVASMYYQFGVCQAIAGSPAKARQPFRQAIALEPNWPEPYYGLARILATHPDETVRQPQEAIKLSERAVRLTKHQNPLMLDTLASSYAVAGRFDEAIKTAQQALAIASSAQSDRLADQIRSKLELYRHGKPFLE